MNNLELLIQKIVRLLNSNDLSNNEDNKKLVDEYIDYCIECNNKINECGKLIKQNMLFEAKQLAEQLDPPLQKQVDILNFSSKKALEELCLIYGWRTLPEIQSYILDKLSDTLFNMEDLTPLLNKYRLIARGDDFKQKVVLLRQIIKLVPEQLEWQDNLAISEEKYFNTLKENAKKAILDKNHSLLEKILKELKSPEWVIKCNLKVINKIEQELNKYYSKELEKKVNLLVENINNAYSNFDFHSLEKSLNDWYDLLRKNNYIPAESISLQIDEAQEYYLVEKKITDDKKHLEELKNQLQIGLINQENIAKLEQIYQEITILGQDVPENIKQQYLSYKDTAEILQRRNKLLKLSAIIASSSLVIIVIIILSYFIVMNAKEKQWKNKITTALKNEVADVSLNMLKELEQQSPNLRRRAEIEYLANKAKNKKAQEEVNRKEFIKLAKVITKNLQDYTKNRKLINQEKAKLLTLVVDQTEDVVYKEIERNINDEHNRYVMTQNRKYISLIKELLEQREIFFTALNNMDLQTTAKAIEKSQDLKIKILAIEDISDDVKFANKRYVDDIEQLEKRQDKEQQNARKRDELLLQLDYPNSFENLIADLEKFICDFSQDIKNINTMQALKISADNAKNRVVSTSGSFENGNLFFEDYNYQKKLISTQEKLIKDAKETFKEMLKTLEENQFCAIVIEDAKKSDVIYDLYFYLDAKIPGISDEEGLNSLMYPALENESGVIKHLPVKYDKTTNIATIEFDENKVYTGNLIYPDGIYRKKRERAPHIEFIREFVLEINRANCYTINSVLYKNLHKLLDKKNINSFLKIKITQKIMETLIKSDEDNEAYKKILFLIENILNITPENYKWMIAYHANPTFQKQLNDTLNEIAKIKLPLDVAFYAELFNVAITREIIPIGYIKNDNKTSKMILFKNVPDTGEMCILSSNKFVLIGKYNKNDITLENSDQILDTQIIYSPTDKRSTQTLTKEFIKKAKELNIGNINWPKTWIQTENGEKL